MKGCDYMNKDLKKIIYYIALFVGTFTLIKINQFNAFSYLFGMCVVYLSRWCYRG